MVSRALWTFYGTSKYMGEVIHAYDILGENMDYNIRNIYLLLEKY